MMPPPIAFWLVSNTKRCAATVEPVRIFFEMLSASCDDTQIVSGESR